MKLLYTNDEIFTGLIKQDEVIISYLYKVLRPMVVNYIVRNSGTLNDAEEIFHNSLLLLYKRINNANFSISYDFTNYFMLIVYRTWINTVKKKKRSILLDNSFFDNLEGEEGLDIYRMMILTIVNEKLTILPDNCRNLLNMYYVKGMSMKNIAEDLGYKNQNAVIKQKYRCLNYLRMLVKTKIKEL